MKSVVYFFDRKQVKELDEAAEFGKIDTHQYDELEFDADDTLAAGEEVWLVQYRKRGLSR